MQFSSEFRRCLIDLDLVAAKKLWAHTHPHLHQPENDQETLLMLHHSRTQSEVIPTKLRAYSHRWLIDNNYPSGLPDDLKPQAERLYPRVVEAVGIAVASKSEYMRPAALQIRGAMEDAVHEAVSDRVSLSDPRVSEMMKRARLWMIKKLFG